MPAHETINSRVCFQNNGALIQEKYSTLQPSQNSGAETADLLYISRLENEDSGAACSYC